MMTAMSEPIAGQAVALFLVDAIEELARCTGVFESGEETRGEFARLEALGPARRPDGTTETHAELACKVAAVLLLRMREQMVAVSGSAEESDRGVSAALDALRAEFR